MQLRSIAILGVCWLYQLRQSVGCIMAGWLRAGCGIKSVFSNAAQRIFEWDRGADGFFEWGRQLAVGLFSGTLYHSMAENSVVQSIMGL